MKLTEGQLRFVDYYVELGNVTHAYLRAYPNVKKETTASANGSRLLGNAKVSAKIAERMEELKSERVADQQEIMEFLTAVKRGEIVAATLIGTGGGSEEISNDMPPTMNERIKAAELLGKRHAMWTDKQQIDVKGAVTFVDDIGADSNDT